jgi:hypothetical protein
MIRYKTPVEYCLNEAGFDFIGEKLVGWDFGMDGIHTSPVGDVKRYGSHVGPMHGPNLFEPEKSYGQNE